MSDPRPALVLASASPRRSQILTGLGIAHEVLPAGLEESDLPGEAPEERAERLAREKALAGASLRPDAWILAGDTLVIVDDEVLEKPRDQAEATEMLMRLSGKWHRVASALALRAPAPNEGGGGKDRIEAGVEVTRVRFLDFDRSEAEAYAATGEPLDKAGAYGIQGLGAVLVERIEGDYTGVVGLPIPLLVRLLREAGRPYRFPGSPPP